MKKFIIISVFFVCAISMSVFSGTADNFKGGRTMLGGGGYFGIDTAGDYDPYVSLYPDFGYFAIDNLLLEIGLDIAFQGESSTLAISEAVKYYLPITDVLVPYFGGEMNYTIIDDISTNEGIMWMRIIGGLDIFLTKYSAFYVQAGLPRYYIDLDASDNYSSDWLYVYFGFHFYIPSGNVGFYN